MDTNVLTQAITAAVSTALTQQASSSGQILSLPEFSGIGQSVSFKSWYNRCMNLFEAFAILDPRRKVANLKLQLTGTAETTMETFLLRNPGTIFETPEIFYTHLAPLFVDPSFPQVLRMKLQNPKQTGSLAEYIASEASSMGDFKDISDAERIYLFKYGLESRYVDLLNLKNPTNFIEAIVPTDIPNINLIDNNYDVDTFLYNINGIENCGKPGHRRANCRRPRQNKNHYNNGFYSGYKGNNYKGKSINPNRNNQYKEENLNAKGYYSNNSAQKQNNFNYTNYRNTRNEENVFTNNENDDINAFEGNEPTALEKKSLEIIPLEEYNSELDLDFNESFHTPPKSPIFKNYNDLSLNKNINDIKINNKINQKNEINNEINQKNQKHNKINKKNNTIKKDKRKYQDREIIFYTPRIKKKTKFFKFSEILNTDSITVHVGKLSIIDPNSPYGLITANNFKLKTLFDSGAGKIFISGKIANKLKIKTKPVENKINAITADGNAKKITYCVDINLQIDDAIIPTTAYIFPLVNVDLIIGFEWWSEHKLSPTYNNNEWVIEYNNKKHSIILELKSNINIISHIHLEKLIKEKAIQELYQVNVTITENSQNTNDNLPKIVNNALTPIIKKYKDVFKDFKFSDIPDRAELEISQINLDTLEKNNVDEDYFFELIKNILIDRYFPQNISHELSVELNKQINKFTVKDNMLLYKKNHVQEVPYVETKNRYLLIKSYHLSLSHMGISTTYNIMKSRAWWPNIRESITKFICECPECQIMGNKKNTIAPLNPLVMV
ncbi:hypothetical protein BB561_006609 [Smittium simulii]|uniref:Integrase zinc-binding domain-containing protein n=1 Tax=Smittium simulii TaxID=133385 RepID=A0A2T9Y2U2_9FUNG|nr:hypothetical protein BB561_006609 [Smittium simulii]